MHIINRKKVIPCIVGLLMGSLWVMAVQAGPVELPDSARPGAVRPGQKEENAPEPNGSPKTSATDRPGAVRPGQEIPDGSFAGTTDSLEIPAVIDRPFNVEECPCIVAKQFRLLQAADMPEYKIVLADVQKILDGKLKEQPAQGYSIGKLQEVANVARNYYRERGLILTQIVIPIQNVEDGVIDFEIYVGKLGRILAEGNNIYSKKILEAPFRNLVGKPIHKADIEAALLRLTDYAGLTVFGVFQPGQLIGTADMVLKIQKEKRFDVAMRVDNQGTVETGQHRFRTVIDWNNPTGGADRLTASIQQSYHPKLNTFKGLEYKRLVYDSSYALDVFYNQNVFDVARTATPVHSESEEGGVSLGKSFKRSRIENLSAKLGFNVTRAFTTAGGVQTDQDRLSVFNLGIDYDLVDTLNLFRAENGGGGINLASLEFRQGLNNFLGSMGTSEEAAALAANPDTLGQQTSRQGRGDRYAEGEFTKLLITYTRLQTVRENINLLFRADLQWSPDLLVPLEQYSVGGADNVRAFPVAQVLWDRALFFSFEFLFNAPFFADKIAFENRTWGELLQLAIFYDHATGRLNSPTVTDRVGFDALKGAGVGLRFNIPGSIESRLFWAWEIGGDTIGNGKRPNIWGDLTYSF